MANERGLGKGIIRLEGTALARPAEVNLPGGLSPAAFELVTGSRTGYGVLFSRSGAPSNGSSAFQEKAFSQSPKNYTDDWWGE